MRRNISLINRRPQAFRRIRRDIIGIPRCPAVQDNLTNVASLQGSWGRQVKGADYLLERIHSAASIWGARSNKKCIDSLLIMLAHQTLDTCINGRFSVNCGVRKDDIESRS